MRRLSTASEEAFDRLQKSAISDQKVVLYFCAILPSGEALQVTSSLLPEVLEEIGPRPPLEAHAPKSEVKIFMEKMKARGQRLAQLMNRTINPMATTLLEVLTEKHNAEQTSLNRGNLSRTGKKD